VGHFTVLAVDNFVNIFLVFLKYLPYLYIIEIKRNMSIIEIYQSEQELAYFNELMSKEILNEEEYEFCKAWDAEEAKNLFHNAWNNTYLNLNLYSEVDKEEYDLRREMGI
jgi:hypothetical protein